MVSTSLLIDLRKIYFYLYKAITLDTIATCAPINVNIYLSVYLQTLTFVKDFHISFVPSGRMPLGISKYRLYLKTFTCIPVDVYLYTCRCLPIYLCSRHSPLLGPLRQDAVRDLHVQVAVPENGLPADLVLARQVHGEAQMSRHRHLQQRVPAVIYLLMTTQSLEYL